MSETRAYGRTGRTHQAAPSEASSVVAGGRDCGGDGAPQVSAKRPWYHPRPKPRRPTDPLGFNGMWWAAVVVAYIAFELLWWSWLL